MNLTHDVRNECNCAICVWLIITVPQKAKNSVSDYSFVGNIHHKLVFIFLVYIYYS